MGASNLSIRVSFRRVMPRHYGIESSGSFERQGAKSTICPVKHTGVAAASTSGTDLLTRSEVSRLLGVSPNTVTRWAREGRLACQVTLGGHHRFERELVEQLRKSLYRAASRPD
jgi:excisionase family DNA binding protein